MTEHHAENARDAMYRAVLDSLDEPILIYDDSAVLYANPAACTALGAPAEADLSGMAVAGFVLPDFADVADARRAYVIHRGIPLRGLRLKVRGADGRPRTFTADIRQIDYDGSTAALATMSNHG